MIELCATIHIVLTPASAKHRTGNFGPCHQAEINIQQ